MVISHTMSILKILTGLCIRKKSVKVKNIFENIDYNVLVVKELW